MDLEDEDEESEDERPRYAHVLEEEEYESEGDSPTGFSGPSAPQDNFETEDPTPEIVGWDPNSHEYFRIQ